MKSEKHWQKIGLYPHHGICLFLSALHSKKSCGIGEFLDLVPIIDWCSHLKMDCLQLLPLNDTGNEPSPYNALSSCALDPVYLSLRDLPEIPANLAVQLDRFIPFNQTQRVSLLEVKRLKMDWLRHYYQTIFPSLSKSREYQEFLKNHSWLEIYALFKSLKEEFQEAYWKEWPAAYHTPKAEHYTSRKQKMDFYSFLQFLCFSQLEKVRSHATLKGLFLKGDVPILLSPDSADVWANPSFFRTDLSAGAPPDLYNPLGQNWGFPVFNWDAMRHSGFAWWKRRLQVAEHLFHIYRIDHVVGFFRIWVIPEGKKPKEGSFIPPDEQLWLGQGKEILEMMLSASTLLPIAEDLGTIPPIVRPLLKELGICSTKVMRWERYWLKDKSYIPFNEYEPFSMTTVSTPDMDTLKLWWKKFPDESIPLAHLKHWTYQPDLKPSQQQQLLHDAHHTTSYFHINLLQEYLAIFPELSWPNPEDERINFPGTLLPTNWTYRFRPSLEEIVSHSGLTDALNSLLKT